jgi:hypothetical protein
MNETCKMGFLFVGYVFIVFFSVTKVSILGEKVSRLDTEKLVETLETSRPRVSRLTALDPSNKKSFGIPTYTCRTYTSNIHCVVCLNRCGSKSRNSPTFYSVLKMALTRKRSGTDVAAMKLISCKIFFNWYSKHFLAALKRSYVNIIIGPTQWLTIIPCKQP